MHIATLSVPLDAEGFLDRRCPYCRGSFKVRGGDYEQLAWPTMTCACCGLSARLQSFTPPDVVAAALAHARNYMTEQVNAMFGGLARSMQGSPVVRIEHRPAPPVAVRRLRAVTDLAIADMPCCETQVKVPFALAAAVFYCPFCSHVHA